MSIIDTFTLKMGFKRDLQMKSFADSEIFYDIFENVQLLDLPPLIKQYFSNMTRNTYFVWDKDEWSEWTSRRCIRTFFKEIILRDGQLKVAIEKKFSVECKFDIRGKLEKACTANSIFYWYEED